MMLFGMRVATAVAKPWLFAIVLAFALCTPDRAVADDRFGLHRPIDRIVVFGDSLSDPGNAYALSGKHLVPDYTPVPPLPPYNTLDPLLVPASETPYKVGGNRFSNGLTWVEQLAIPIGLWGSVRPAFVKSEKGSSNYAVGGTRARNEVDGEVWLSQQAATFLEHVDGEAPSNALYVVAVGSLDVKDAAEAALQGNDPRPIILGALGGVNDAIRLLHEKGARKFLVWNVPNLALTPAIQTLNAGMPGTAGFVEGLTRLYNGGVDGNGGLNGVLNAMLDGPYQLDGINIIKFDAFGRLQHVVDNSEKYGLQNDTQACIRPGTPPPSRCQNQDRYLFWDGIHPTRAGHSIIAFEVVRAILKELQDH